MSACVLAAGPAIAQVAHRQVTRAVSVGVAAAAQNPNAAGAAFNDMTEPNGSASCSWSAPRPASVSSQTVTDIQTYHVGNVILTGRSSAGVAATDAASAAL